MKKLKLILLLLLSIIIFNKIYSKQNLIISLNPSIKKNALIEVKDQNNNRLSELTQLSPDKPFIAEVDPENKFYITQLQFAGEKGHSVSSAQEGLGPFSSGNHILCIDNDNIKCPSQIRKEDWPNVVITKK